jgi:hypothetical protein
MGNIDLLFFAEEAECMVEGRFSRGGMWTFSMTWILNTTTSDSLPYSWQGVASALVGIAILM